MAKVKTFEKFLEGYSEDLNHILSNNENNYVVIKGNDIIGGYEYIEDAFENVSELLAGDGTIDEEQVYEFNDLVSQMISSDVSDDELIPQDEIEQVLNEILDKFGIIEPYKIMNRMELEETPVDVYFDEDGKDSSEELEEYLGESVTSEPYCIVGSHRGEMEEVDSFMSHEEADTYLDDYKKIYDEFDDMKVIHRDEMNESNLIFTPDNKDCGCDIECKCHDNGECTCGEDCDCENCKEMRKVSTNTNNTNESRLKRFSDF